MAKSQLRLVKIEIHQLKGLRDVEIDFSEKPLIGILGPNGVGKSTILHALSCVNNPVTTPFASVNHRLSEFFTPTTHSIWAGSSFDIIQSFREGVNITPNHRTRFRKNMIDGHLVIVHVLNVISHTLVYELVFQELRLKLNKQGFNLVQYH